ncbi:hypothetical protein GOBAR_AA31037 [Gossypium barbadense]|uniref:Uncharacterized protein n=1 Tax=Gossypium barbadense TaxID=3634 RepID=A0A2P5WF11_GOSBA|nr:hypothetical protein GOBAR_AA31037 [Gossypium barbadense]
MEIREDPISVYLMYAMKCQLMYALRVILFSGKGFISTGRTPVASGRVRDDLGKEEWGKDVIEDITTVLLTFRIDAGLSTLVITVCQFKVVVTILLCSFADEDITRVTTIGAFGI